MTKIVFIGGPQGVGKTSLGKRVASEFPKQVKYFYAGQHFARFLSEKLGDKNPHLLTEQELNAVQKHVSNELKKFIDMHEPQVVLVDSHYTIPYAEEPEKPEFTRIFRETAKAVTNGNGLKIDHYVLLTAEPKEIIHRRIKTQRKTYTGARPISKKAALNALVAEGFAAKQASRENQIALTKIYNAHGKEGYESAKEELTNIVESYLEEQK